MLRFFLSNILLAACVAILILWAIHASWLHDLPSFWRETLILLILTNTVIFRYLNNARKPAVFTQLYLGTIVIKLLAYCGFCLWMAMADKGAAGLNLTFFLLAYFAFTTLEVGFLYAKISRENRP